MSQIKEVAITIDPISIDTRDTVNLPYNAHNGNSVTKMAISPQSKCIVTYSQDDGTYISWSNDSNDDGKISLKYDSSPSLFRSISFKVSDEKIIILDGESIYDMNQKPCSIIKHDYKMKGNRDAKYDFLSNGDIVAYHKRAISIYSSDGRKRKAEHKLNKEDKIFDGVINDKLLVFVDNNLFILDLLQLSKIHYLKVLFVININGTLYIYSNNNNIYVPIGVIDHSTLVQDFGIIHDDKDEYIITISNDDISIHSWKKKLKKNTNINELYTAFKSENDPNIDFNDRFVHIEFKDNKAYLYYSHEKVDYKLIINPDGVNGNENENTLKLKGINDENIFYNIKKFSDEDQFIEHYIDLIKKQNEVKKEQNKNELIKEVRKKNKNHDEYSLILISNGKKIYSYDTKLKCEEWKYKKVCDNTLLFYGGCDEKGKKGSYCYKKFIEPHKRTHKKTYKKRELYIYTLDMGYKIQKKCFNIEFLEYATKSRLNSYEIDEIVNPTDNLKKQWILYLLSQKDFLTRYGIRLLKLAIEKNNEDLIKDIIEKTLEYYKENQNLNIYILSIICKNMNRLGQKYSDFLLNYYDKLEKMEKKIFPKLSDEYIYNNFDHLHSLCMELETRNSIFNSVCKDFVSCGIWCTKKFWCIKNVVFLFQS
ncbi:unnamed protein product [Rhizophagus irregularis]|uniref:Uncharacterized protein n=1 Tax=Rhizophagus irregularis TaxID=588596 RepID=A0A916EE68_9GLOM|nr:unnamed protein product [Rhizophagus irregularis]CAB5384029.1 unnamed protein product [Rhizophagus irregularis]